MAARKKARKRTARKGLAAARRGAAKYHAFVKAEQKKGKTFKQAVAAWKKSKKSAPKARKSSKKSARKTKRSSSSSLGAYRKAVRAIEMHLYKLARNAGASGVQAKRYVMVAMSHIREDLEALAIAIASNQAARAARLRELGKKRAAARLEKQLEKDWQHRGDGFVMGPR